MLRENSDSTFYGVLPGQEGTTTLTANLRPLNFWGGLFAATATATTGRYYFPRFCTDTDNDGLRGSLYESGSIVPQGDKTTALQAYTDAVRLNFDMLVPITVRSYLLRV